MVLLRARWSLSVGVMLSGLAGSLVGFFGSLLAGHALSMALISYSLTGICTALLYVLASAPVPVRN